MTPAKSKGAYYRKVIAEPIGDEPPDAAGCAAHASLLDLFARGDVDAAQHEREADQVEKLRTFPEKGEGHRRSEHGHHMKERRRAIGADQLNAAVEAEIGDRRRKHRDVD